MIGTGSYTTSTTNMYNNTDFTYVDLDVDRDLAGIHGPHQTLLVLRTVQQLGVHRTRFTEWDGAWERKGETGTSSRRDK
jgi:hypothetical protein